MLSPMPWFLLASGVYFGFGPLVYFYGTATARSYSQDVWQTDTHDLFRVTLLNAVGVILVVAVWLWQTRRMVRVKSQPFALDNVVLAIVAFYAIGAPARCITILCYWKVLHFTAPGFLTWLANFTAAGLVLLTATALHRGGAWWLLFWMMLALDIGGGLTNFSKAPIILSIFPCIFGYMLCRPRMQAVLWIPVILLVVYLASNSYVSYVRAHDQQGDTITDRVQLAKFYLGAAEKREKKLFDESQSWWIRLNYANVQEFAMQEYNEGSPGESFRLIPIAAIPRILWPEKPIIESGYGFYRKLSGQETASFGIGFFAEAYWNGGWWYVVLTSIVVGWLFGTITVLIAKEESLGNLWILPIALLWVKSGGRADGWVHTEIVGPAVFTLLYIGLMRFCFPASPVRLRKRPSPGQQRSQNGYSSIL
jgi:hypothetical protein